MAWEELDGDPHQYALEELEWILPEDGGRWCVLRARKRGRCGHCPEVIEQHETCYWNTISRVALHVDCVDPVAGYADAMAKDD